MRGGPWLDLRPLDSATEEVQEYPSSTEAHPASPTAPGPAPATAPATCAAGGVAQGPGGSSGSSGSSGTSSSGSSSSGGSNKSDCSSSGACSQAQARHTVVLVMTRPAVAQLLGGHPDEGVRWQVHSSCVAPQAALVMEILGHLAGLRHELARASGHDSHAAALLQGSLPAEPGALLSFLQQFAAALHAPAASDAADLARLARAAGLEVNGPGSSSSSRGSSGSTHSQSQEQRRKGLGCQQQEIAAQPQQYPQQEPPESQQAHPMQPMFDAWNVDFLLRAAMQRAHAASARTAGARVGGTERYGSLLSDWRQYAEYFTLGSLLQVRLAVLELRQYTCAVCTLHGSVSHLRGPAGMYCDARFVGARVTTTAWRSQGARFSCPIHAAPHACTLAGCRACTGCAHV